MLQKGFLISLTASIVSLGGFGFSQGFVGTNGHHFWLDGEPVRAVGANNYYMMYTSDHMIDAVLDAAVAMNLQVIRTWAFLDRGSLDGSVPDADPPGPRDGIYFQYWDAEAQRPAYNDGEDGLERLDYIVHAASQRGLKLIMVFTNNWEAFGGMDQYVTWYDLPYHSDFYTDVRVKGAYKDWVAHLVNRVNTHTGVAYKDDPAIFAWELANEPRCRGGHDALPASPDCDTGALLAWASEMSTFVKEQAPNHLVAVGDEGFFNRPGEKDWTHSGSEGVDSEAFLELPSVDFGTYHLYPDHWGKSPEWGTEWIREHLKLAKRVGKPVLLEEFGWQDQDSRAEVYRQWLDTIYEQDGAGDLYWMLAAQRDDGSLYPDYDGFTVYASDDVADLIRAHALRMQGARE